jgi:hypothetical protein
MLFMSMGWDYFSELRPPTGLLFIPQMIFDYRKRRWNDMDRRKAKKSKRNLPQCPPQFSHGLTRVRTGASTMRDRRLTAWAMTRPTFLLPFLSSSSRNKIHSYLLLYVCRPVIPTAEGQLSSLFQGMKIIHSYNKLKLRLSIVTTHHGGAGGREDIAPTHSWSRHWMRVCG